MKKHTKITIATITKIINENSDLITQSDMKAGLAYPMENISEKASYVLYTLSERQFQNYFYN